MARVVPDDWEKSVIVPQWKNKGNKKKMWNVLRDFTIKPHW